MTISLPYRRRALLLVACTVATSVLLRTATAASAPEAFTGVSIDLIPEERFLSYDLFGPGNGPLDGPVTLPPAYLSGQGRSKAPLEVSPATRAAPAQPSPPVADVSAAQLGPDVNSADLQILEFSNTALPPEPIKAGDRIHYTFLITNKSDGPITNVVVTDTKDYRTYYNESLPRFSSRLDENTFVWRVGTLQPGDPYTILFILGTGPSIAGQVVHNSATVDSDQTDPFTDVCDTLMGREGATPGATATHTPTATPTRTATPTATPMASPTATTIAGAVLRLAPPEQYVATGQSFDQHVLVEAGPHLLAAADVFIDVDLSYLEVLDISDGTGLDIIVKHADPLTGEIDIGAGNLGAPAQGSFELATLHLKAKIGVETATTHIRFSLDSPRRTVLKDDSDHNVLGNVYDATVHIILGSVPRIYLPIMIRES